MTATSSAWYWAPASDKDNIMTRFFLSKTALILLALSSIHLAQAKAPAEQVERLSRDLTPVGAERAGNKSGTIPAWDGGLVKPPAGFDATQGWSDPYAADKPLYVITGANAEQYKEMLAPGQMALLKRYPNYKMAVYPTRRSAGYPAAVYENVRKEAAAADTANDGNSVVNASATTVPFPLPRNGVEAIWNHIFRYRGITVDRTVSEFPVQANGSFTPVKRQEEIIFALGMTPPSPGKIGRASCRERV
jgi:hypothetical protein